MNATAHSMPASNRMPHQSSSHATPGIFASIAHTLEVWRTRMKDRDAFAALTYRDLRDINLSQWEVEQELAKPFWRG